MLDSGWRGVRATTGVKQQHHAEDRWGTVGALCVSASKDVKLARMGTGGVQGGVDGGMGNRVAGMGLV